MRKKKSTERKGITSKDTDVRHHVRVIFVLGLICTVIMLGAMAFTICSLGETMTAFWICMMILALYIAALTISLYIETQLGYHVCGNCGKKFVPKFVAVYFSMHFGWTRHLRCPKCGKKTWCKKVWK